MKRFSLSLFLMLVLVAATHCQPASAVVTIGVDLDPNTPGIQTEAFFDPDSEFMVDFVAELTADASVSLYSVSVRYDAEELTLVNADATPPAELSGFTGFGGPTDMVVNDPDIGPSLALESFLGSANPGSDGPAGPTTFTFGTATFRLSTPSFDGAIDFQPFLIDGADLVADNNNVALVLGQDLAFVSSSVTAIPEPTTWTALGCLSAGYGVWRRRRQG